jgi:hypothetical protein
MEEMFGLVPSFFKLIPDSSLELEWRLFKRVQFDEGSIPNKYRELIGVAISAVTKCRYCTLFHSIMNKLKDLTLRLDFRPTCHDNWDWTTINNFLEIITIVSLHNARANFRRNSRSQR